MDENRFLGSHRSVLGNVAVALLAILAQLNYLPWAPTDLIIIMVAIVASLPSSRRKIEPPQTLPSNTVSSPVLPVQSQSESFTFEQRPVHSQTRPIQRLPQAIIEALRLVPTIPALTVRTAPIMENKEEPEIDIGRPVQHVVAAGDYESFQYGLHEDEELSVDVTGDGPLNVYVLTEENLNSLDADQEFWYETGSERTRSASLKFVPEESGTWFLVIENCETRDVTATIKVNIRSQSHPVPFLKSEKLDLPGGKLEGKLSS